MTTKPDNMPQVKQFWNDIAHQFDAIYTGKEKAPSRARWTNGFDATFTSALTG